MDKITFEEFAAQFPVADPVLLKNIYLMAVNIKMKPEEARKTFLFFESLS